MACSVPVLIPVQNINDVIAGIQGLKEKHEGSWDISLSRQKKQLLKERRCDTTCMNEYDVARNINCEL